MNTNRRNAIALLALTLLVASFLLSVVSLASPMPICSSNALATPKHSQVLHAVEPKGPADVLVYTDDAHLPPSQRYPIVALDNLWITYVHYADDPSGFGAALTSQPWDLVVVSHNNYYAVGNYWTELETYVLNGGRLVLSTFDVDGSHSELTTLWNTLGAQWTLDMFSPEPVYRWMPTHPIFTFPNTVGDLTSWADQYADDGDHVAVTTGTAVAGFTASPTTGYAAIVEGNSGRTVLMSFLLSEFDSDEDVDGKLDAVELWENAINYVYVKPPPGPPEDLELVPRMVSPVWEPINTQWHELYPVQSHDWYMTSWEPGKVLGPTDIIDLRLADSKIVFEEAHYPVYTIGTNPAAEVTGGYSEFANYLTANGYMVSTIDPGTTIDSAVLAAVDVLVIVAPMASYSTSELDAIETWVKGGGKLLLISDAVVYGLQARTIAARLNTVLKGDAICDSDENVGADYWPYYDGANLVYHHPPFGGITDGVARVEMYYGDGITSVAAPEFPLIVTDSDGTAYWSSDLSPALGTSVMSAMEMGAGRLIVIGDCNVWDSAWDIDGDGDINFYDSDNEILALNSVHWLAYDWYEVDEVTIDLVVLDEGDVTHWLDYECGYWTFDPENPICTKWNEIKPDQDRCWHLTSWDDNGDGKLSACDYIDMTPMFPNPGPVAWFHVEKVTVTLKLTSLGIPEVQLWTSKNAMPTARGQSAVITGDDGLIYVMGGFNQSPELNIVEAYDPLIDTWTTKAPMPQATRGAAVAKGFDGTIYVISGYGPPGVLLSTVQAYNPATDTWTLKAPIPMPVWEAGAATGGDGKIYVIGGEAPPAVSAVQVYDPSTDSWTTKTSMPTARMELGVVAGYDGLIYAIGGHDGLAALSTVEAYDPWADTWTARSPLPTALCQFGATLDPTSGKIYVIGGGTSYYNNEGPFYKTTYSYDVWFDVWMTELEMPTARRELGVAAARGKIYAIGGGNAGFGGPYGNWNEEASTRVEASLEFVGTLDEFQLMDHIHNPVCTLWHEIWPQQSRIWHLGSWEDSPMLSPSDQIRLAPADYHRFVVMIGDASVHCAPSGLPGYPLHGYGGDPGRDEIMGTDDDLDYWQVIAKLASGRITVFTVDYAYYGEAYTNFDYIASQTGGIHFDGYTAWDVSIANEIKARIGAGWGDVVFTYDLSASLGYYFEEMKTKTKAIIDALSTLDVEFGVGTHVDYPHYYDSFGYAADYGYPMSGDYAWSMDTDITDGATAKSVIQSVVGGAYNGADWPENYARVLYECQYFGWRGGAEYHVDKVTVAMHLTSKLDGREHIVKFEGSLDHFMKYHWNDPVSTQWHEVSPDYCRQWHIIYWEDTNPDWMFEYCDQIVMVDKETGWVEEFHVESLSTDIIVTQLGHDVAVVDVTPAKTIVGEGYSVSINVTVENQGNFTETFEVFLYADTYIIGTSTVNDLPPGNQTILSFVWDTTGVAKGNYTISATAVPPLDDDWADNEKIDGIITVTIPGDVDGNFWVNIYDVVKICAAYDSVPPGPPYQPNYDLNCDGIINIYDVVIACSHYDEKYP